MGIDIQITLKNEKEIRGLFKKLRKVWRQRPMKQAMEEALWILQEDAQFYAPHWHGDLRDSIMSEIFGLLQYLIFLSLYYLVNLLANEGHKIGHLLVISIKLLPLLAS